MSLPSGRNGNLPNLEVLDFAGLEGNLIVIKPAERGHFPNMAGGCPWWEAIWYSVWFRTEDL